VVDVGFGVKTSFDFGLCGQVHVMVMTDVFGGLVWVATADPFPSPWIQTTVANGYYYGPGDLVVDPSGTTHVAWHNHTLTEPEHATIDSSANITNYQIVTLGNHNGWDNSLSVDAGGGLHMASVDPSGFGASQSLEYSSFDGQPGPTKRSPRVIPSCMDSTPRSRWTSPPARPHITYRNATDWTTIADHGVRSGTGSWQIMDVTGGSGILGRFPTLALDENDTPHLAWLDLSPTAQADQPTSGTIKYAVMNVGGAGIRRPLMCWIMSDWAVQTRESQLRWPSIRLVSPISPTPMNGP
jgi:hypothetical protein